MVVTGMGMGMEKTLIPGLLVLVRNLELMCETVPVQRPQCKTLAELVTGLNPLLEEIQMWRHPLTELTVNTFRALMHALIGAQRVVKKIKECSKVKLFFRIATLTGQLSEATINIRACISSLPLVQLRISAEMREEIKRLNWKLGELGEELKESNSMRKDQQDLAAEVTDVLRAHNVGEASSSVGAAKIMDSLIAWLAKHFDSDLDTVRQEWEVMKEEVMYLREKVEFASEDERQLEEERLQTLIYIDTDDRQCPACAARTMEDHYPSAARTELETPKEFICPICLQTLADPVITGTGFTYCRKCITNWFKDNDTCPNTRRSISKNTIDNIAVRSLISRQSRWAEISHSGIGTVPTLGDTTPSISGSSDASFNQALLEELINEQEVQHEETITLDRNFSPRSAPSSSSPQAPVKSVTTYILLLSSKRPMQILKSLKELTSLASFSRGQVQVFEAGGIPALAQLLKEKDSSIAEKAAGVLEAITFEIKGDRGESTLPFEQRYQICSAVAEMALGGLTDLMVLGSSGGRLKAAQVVINILDDEEIRAEVSLQSQVVSAFFTLINDGEGLLFPDEGKSLCIKGLNLLSGEKATAGAAEEGALTIALLRVAASGVSPQVVEESLFALRSVVGTGGETVCKTMHANKAIPFLVRSISRLPSGRGREDALDILNEMCLLDGMPDVILKYELFFHLLPVLNEANHDGGYVNAATRLLNTCLSSVRGDISHVLSQADLKGLVGLLGLRRTSVTSKVDILSSLEYLCRESLPLRVAFLNSAGVATLQVLVKSFEAMEIKEGVARLMRILASFPACCKDICNQGGMQLLNCLLVDDSLSFTQAVVAAESVMTCPECFTMSWDGFPHERVVALLATTYELECREAAAGILTVLASRNAVMETDWNEMAVEFLLDMVRPDFTLPSTARKKAAEALLAILTQENSTCLHVVEEDGLAVLVDFGLTLGADGRVMIIQLLSIFCKGDSNCKQAVLEVGGPKILLEGLEKGKMLSKMQEESAVALVNLVESAPARKAVLQSGFIQIALKCIQANGGNHCSVELTRALVAVLDSKANALSIRESDGIQALLSVLEGSAEIGKKVAAIALTKLMRLDHESSILLGRTQGISSLYKFLVYQEAEGSQPLDDVEALEALSAASEEQRNKFLIVEERGIPLLISISARGSPRAQELALSILLNLSRDGPAPAEYDIWGVLTKEKICKQLFEIVEPESELSFSETAVFKAICIIRNLSLTGAPARTAMLEEGDGAVKVLLDRIRYHDANASIEAVWAAVIALERFMLSTRGKMVLIREGGIRVIVQVLHYRLGSGQAKSFAIKILVMMAQESQASKEVCLAIFEANVIPGLRDILELGPSPECKLQACTLLKFLMYNGPRAAVCKRIREEQCIPKLLDLRSHVTCHEAATGALDLLKNYDKESRKLIAEVDQHLSWSRTSSLSP